MKRLTSPLMHGGHTENHPEIIVVHAIAEYVDDGKSPVHAVRFLHDYGLSAHALVAPDGVVYRCRNDNQTAWHALGYNQDSLGIEFLVKGVHDYGSFINAIEEPRWATSAQLEAGAEQIREWCGLYGIDRDAIARHSTLSPGRKLDPGDGFQFDELMDKVFS